MDTPQFNGKWITLPWKGWEDVEISPEGIRTHRGVISPAKLNLLFWKASFFDRGLKDAERMKADHDMASV